MTPQRCISGAGEFGDCYRACLATILDLPASEVPNFGHLAKDADNDELWRLARDWLAPRGLGIFQNWVNGEWPLEKLLRLFSRDNPGVPFIIHGEAALKGSGDINHAVVALNGEIAHDPSGAGIVGPAVNIEGEQEYWWIDIIALAALNPVPSSDEERPGGFVGMHFDECDYFISRGTKSCNKDCCS